MDEKRIVNFLTHSFRSFLEKMLRRGWIKRFAFATRLPAGKWPSVRFAIQLTNKNSKLVAISR